MQRQLFSSIGVLIKRLGGFCLLIFVLCYSVAGDAEVKNTHVYAQKGFRHRSEIGIEGAKIAIQNKYPGTILRIWRKPYQGRDAYYVRTLSPSGKVHTHVVDGVTAEIIK